MVIVTFLGMPRKVSVAVAMRFVLMDNTVAVVAIVFLGTPRRLTVMVTSEVSTVRWSLLGCKCSVRTRTLIMTSVLTNVSFVIWVIDSLVLIVVGKSLSMSTSITVLVISSNAMLNISVGYGWLSAVTKVFSTAADVVVEVSRKVKIGATTAIDVVILRLFFCPQFRRVYVRF